VKASTEEPAALAQRVAAAVLAHPGVVALHGGPFNTVATHLPGRRLIGVRLGVGTEPVELAVVLGMDRPLLEVVAALRTTVSRMCAGAAVDITVADVAVPGQPPPTGVSSPQRPADPGRMAE
jgi:hypothetical protein